MTAFTHASNLGDALEDIRHTYLAYAAIENMLEPVGMLRGEQLEIRTEEISALVRTLNRALFSNVTHMQMLLDRSDETPPNTGKPGNGPSGILMPIHQRKAAKG